MVLHRKLLQFLYFPACMTVLLLSCVGLVHTDDRLTLLDIARQLDVEEELGDRVSVNLVPPFSFKMSNGFRKPP